MDPSKVLRAFGLSRKVLLAVALLAVVAWWYHQVVHQTLNTWETAVVVLALALVVAGAQDGLPRASSLLSTSGQSLSRDPHDHVAVALPRPA
jgi:hypothetical protein